MNKDSLKKAVEMGRRLRHTMIATADSNGFPHIAVAGNISLAGENQVAVTAWFCPGTVANIEVNPRISLAVWDVSGNTGYQLLGKSVSVEEKAVLDGGPTAMEMLHPIPQVEKRIVVEVEHVLEFTDAPHEDVEI